MNERRNPPIISALLQLQHTVGWGKWILLSAPQTATAGRVLEWDTEPPAAATAAGQGRRCVPLNVSQCAAGSRRQDADTPSIHPLNRGPERQRGVSL